MLAVCLCLYPVLCLKLTLIQSTWSAYPYHLFFLIWYPYSLVFLIWYPYALISLYGNTAHCSGYGVAMGCNGLFIVPRTAIVTSQWYHCYCFTGYTGTWARHPSTPWQHECTAITSIDSLLDSMRFVTHFWEITPYILGDAIDQSHRYRRPQAASREPAGSYDKTTRTAICFEHKTQYLLIRAPYTRIVVFWHISNIPPMISQSQISCNIPSFIQQQYLWNIAIQPAVGCYNSWANLRSSGCYPLG